MSGRPLAGWRWRRRLFMALLAAFVISLPLLWMPVIGGSAGLVFWASLFVPALLGILLVQAPLKTALIARGWGRGATVAAVLAANVVLVHATVGALGLYREPRSIVLLTAAALAAAAIWTIFDDKALYGGARGTQGRPDA